MQKILRAIAASFFLIFIGVSYFAYHPGYLNLDAFQAKSFCPTGGALFCGPGLTWQLIILAAVLVFSVSLYHWMYKGDPEVKWSIRPVTLFLYAQLFLLFVLSLYFFQSNFSAKYVIGWGNAMFSFMTLWGVMCFYLVLFVTVAAFLGYRILHFFHTSFRERSVRIALAIALGMSALIFVFSILGQLGLFSLGPIIAVAVTSFAISYPVWRKVINDLFWEPIPITFAYNRLSWFLVAILAIVLTMNVIDVLRPFPIGWDDLGVYMNFPRQIALHNGLLAGYSGQAYMLITALGFTLAHSTTLAMFFSWLGGALAVYALYAFGKQFVSSEAGLLMAAVMYSLPMVMHQSFADMKTDMGLFFFIVAAFICLFLAIQEQATKDRFWRLMVLTGVFLGIALAIKVTTAIALFPILAILAWRFSGVWSGIAAFALLNSLYFYKFVTAADILPSTRMNIASVSLVVAILALGWAIFTKEKLLYWLRSVAIMGAACAFIFSPWLVKNISEVGAVTVDAMMWGGAAPAPTINWAAINVDPNSCTYTSVNEELGRYISQDTGWGRYTVLPWDMTMNVNQSGFYVDISFLFLAFIGILLLFTPGLWSLIVFALTGIVVPLLSLALPIGEVLSYVPIVLFGAMGLAAFYNKSEEPEARRFWQNVVMLFILCWYFWLFIASGVPWYGVAGFLFALLLVVRSVQLSINLHKGLRILMTGAVVLSLLSTVLLRETKFGSANLLTYAFGIKSEEQVLAATNSLYPSIIKTLNSDLEHPVYRVGTFINYFVDNNRERVFDDAQLDAFKCIDGDGIDNTRTVLRLKTLGFRYLVYDTNTASIEKDPNGTLHQKTKRFMDFARSSLYAVAPTDPNNVKSGIILFEIK